MTTMLYIFWTLVAILIKSYFAWSLITLIQSVRAARKTGLPVLISCVDATNPLWLILSIKFAKQFFQIFNFLGLDGLGCSYFGWMHLQRSKMHEKYGSAFAVASPGAWSVVIVDPATIKRILINSKSFGKPPAFYRMLEVYGPNVVTTMGRTWQRHRKATTAPFNEINSELVWTSSLRQAEKLVQQSWSKKSGISSTHADMTNVSLDVLSRASLGEMRDAADLTENSGDSSTYLSYKTSLSVVLESVFGSLLLPRFLQPQRVTSAYDALEGHFARAMMEEKQKLLSGDESQQRHGTLVSVLVQESEKAGQDRLSDQEIRNNLFMYNLAGHDTTANALTNAIYLLSTKPEVQAWVREQIRQVLPGNDIKLWQYRDVYPRLNRCLAVMHESLRLYGALDAVPRHTLQQESLDIQLRLSDAHPTRVTIPAGIGITPVFGIMQVHPDYWGPQSLEWIPQRWIDNTGQISSPALQDDAFFPWIAGPRVCPGMKFSKVEFVAVLATLLKDMEVRVVVREGETEEAAEKRVLECLDDNQFMPTKRMINPELVTVVWKRV